MKKNYYFTTDLTQYYEASNTTMWESALIKDNTNELEITDVKISNLSNIVALDPLVQTSSPVITQNIPSELLQTNKGKEIKCIFLCIFKFRKWLSMNAMQFYKLC